MWAISAAERSPICALAQRAVADANPLLIQIVGDANAVFAREPQTVPVEDVLDVALGLDDGRYGIAQLTVPPRLTITKGALRAKCSEIVRKGPQVFADLVQVLPPAIHAEIIFRSH
jgi:hypothetical protein